MNQVEYLQEQWRCLAREFKGDQIALYGAGRHTAMMLHATATSCEQPPITVILDDDPPSDHLGRIPIRRPDEVDPAGFAGVVVSTDALSGILTRRAQAWTRRAPDGARPRIIQIYERVLPAYETVTEPPPQDGFGFAVPDSDLRAGYTPENDTVYLQRGSECNQEIRKLLADNGRDPASLGRILDWGCSTGRVLRFWADLAETTDVWGCDIDEDAIDWAVRHLAPPFRFFSTTLAPSIPVADHTFDLVYGISIFTHIDANIDTWLMELRRITAPDGLVMVTIHDEHTWARCAREPDLYLTRHWPGDFNEPLTDDFVSTGCGPGSQTFWHSDGVRRRWSQFFEILEMRPGLVTGTQTGVLMRPV